MQGAVMARKDGCSFLKGILLRDTDKMKDKYAPRMS